MITEAAARDAFKKWQRVLKLRDVRIDIVFGASLDDCYMEAEPECAANRSTFTIRVDRAAMELNVNDFWALTFHELAHVVLWPFADVVEIFRDCDEALVATAEKVETQVAESIAYKLEQIVPKLVRMPKSLKACN